MKPQLNGYVLNQMLMGRGRNQGPLLKDLALSFGLPMDITLALTPDSMLWTVVKDYFEITWETPAE